MARKSLLYINLFITLFFFLPMLRAGEKTFTVVIDAGHGGKDPGARGTIINEKEINLSVALKLGKLIEEHHDDVRVIYTRKTDRFIELDERANIANRNKADLFISIHTNAVKRGSHVKGTEIYTLGLARNDENLEVAMRENSAILLEDNYQQKYEGFDPNSSESYIIFEFIQNKHVEQSVSLASEVQKCFTTAERVNRGVRQAGFLVLRKTGMPSILVELGYISNREEERFMKTENGRNTLAKALYNAFTKYKRDYDRRQGALAGSKRSVPTLSYVNQPDHASDGSDVTASSASTPAPPPGSEADILSRRQDNRSARSPRTAQTVQKTELLSAPRSVKQTSPQVNKRSAAAPAENVNTDTKGVVIYKIQILTSDKKLSPKSRLFKGYKNVDFYVEKGIYKYTYGESPNFGTIRKLRKKIVKDFKDAFIVAFQDGKKVKY